MPIEYRLNLFNFLNCLSEILDWLDPVLNNHHKQVALIAVRMARALNLPEEEVNEIICAGILHDMGAMSLKERMQTLQFEYTTGQVHAEMGYHLLKLFEPMHKAADIVRHHHVLWNYGEGITRHGIKVPIGSRILHVADRASLLIDRKKNILSQIEDIKTGILKISGSMLEPALVDVLIAESDKEYFWLDIVSPFIDRQLKRAVKLETIHMDRQQLLSFAALIRKMIDFRSPFTATHSSGVAATTEQIGRLAGMNENECFTLRVAGYLHDLGKMAIPTEIIEKPGKLTKEEMNKMKAHTFYTYRTLENIEDLETINEYASYHHERLDGTGYPFGLEKKEMKKGSLVLAVADVFTAITEDRPYRKGMSNEQVIRVLTNMAKVNKLDQDIVSLVLDNYDEINQVRINAQNESRKEYKEFLMQFGESL